MQNILEKIYQEKLVEVRNNKKMKNLHEICKELKNCNISNNFIFFEKLKERHLKNETTLICEVKKASPSKGVIRADFNHIEIAKTYEKSGATCLSILTDEKYFHGSTKYLEEIRKITNLPILRKEFIVDKYQIYEAKLAGADCILLIVAMLDFKKLQELEECALSQGLSVLIEVHDEYELETALKLKSKLIGINNRNLKTLEVDISNSFNLVKKIPKCYIPVSESGLKTVEDIKKLKDHGINCFLIGEHFMQFENFSSEVKKFANC